MMCKLRRWVFGSDMTLLQQTPKIVGPKQVMWLRRSIDMLVVACLLMLSGCGALWESMYPSEASKLPTYAFHLASTQDAPGLLPWSDGPGRHTLYLQRESLLTRSDIKGASPMVDAAGQFFVAIRLSDSGSRKLTSVSRDHIGQSLALVTGGHLIGSALIDGPIDKGLFAMAVTSRNSAFALADFLAPDRPVQ
jgi:hypothetical protein